MTHHYTTNTPHRASKENSHALTPAARRVLGVVRRMLGDSSGALSNATIAAAAGLSESTVSIAMRVLAERGMLSRQAPATGGRGHGYTVALASKGSPPADPSAAPASARPVRGDRPPAVYTVLGVLHALMPPNVPTPISNATIAAAAGLSESTVSTAMAALAADQWIDRLAPETTGRGHGYTIVLHSAPGAPERGNEGSNDSGDGSDMDRPCMVDHDLDQHDQLARSIPSDLREELAGDNPNVVRQVLAACPDLTLAEFKATIAVAAARPDVRSPRGLALHCLRVGLRPAPAHRAPAPRSATERHGARRVPWDTPDQLAAYFAAQRGAQSAEHQGAAELPADATDAERQAWHARIAGGYTPGECLDHLLTARYQAEHLPVLSARGLRYASHA